MSAFVRNIHERELDAPPARVGELLDSLASQDDALWPHHLCPRMRFDRPLGVGAHGGHGPIRYVVEEYAPGESVTFRFVGPRGFDGFHRFDRISTSAGKVALRHTLEMTTRGRALLSWPLVFRPLHDALIEDAFAAAEAALGREPRIRPWSWRVRLLRAILAAVSSATSPSRR